MIPLFDRPRIYPRLRRGLFMGQVHPTQVRLAQGPAPGGVMPSQGLDAPTNLAVNGAILQVQVSQPGQSGGQTFTAMIDSGASISCITIQAAQQMGLQQVSSTQLGGVGGSSEAPIYAAALNLVQYGVKLDPVQIAGVANPLPGVDMLIGRDVLRQGLEFDYKGSEGTFNVSQTQAPPTTQSQVAAQPPTPGTVPVPPSPTAPQAPQNLPQPPAQSGTILGMKPLVAVGAGVAGIGLVVGGLFLFKVL